MKLIYSTWYQKFSLELLAMFSVKLGKMICIWRNSFNSPIPKLLTVLGRKILCDFQPQRPSVNYTCQISKGGDFRSWVVHIIQMSEFEGKWRSEISWRVDSWRSQNVESLEYLKVEDPDMWIVRKTFFIYIYHWLGSSWMTDQFETLTNHW